MTSSFGRWGVYGEDDEPMPASDGRVRWAGQPSDDALDYVITWLEIELIETDFDEQLARDLRGLYEWLRRQRGEAPR